MQVKNCFLRVGHTKVQRVYVGYIIIFTSELISVTEYKVILPFVFWYSVMTTTFVYRSAHVIWWIKGIIYLYYAKETKCMQNVWCKNLKQGQHKDIAETLLSFSVESYWLNDNNLDNSVTIVSVDYHHI